MENTGHGSVAMDRFTSKGGCVVAAGFIGWCFLALIIGGEGPDIFVQNEYINPMAHVIPRDVSTGVQEAGNTWTNSMDKLDNLDDTLGQNVEYTKTSVVVKGLTRKNQVLYVQALVEKPGWGNKVLDGLDVSFNQEMAVWHSGYHEDMHLVCDMITEKITTESDMKAAGHLNLTFTNSFASEQWKVNGKLKLTGFLPATGYDNANTPYGGTDFNAEMNAMFRKTLVETLNGDRNKAHNDAYAGGDLLTAVTKTANGVSEVVAGVGDGTKLVDLEQIQVTMTNPAVPDVSSTDSADMTADATKDLRMFMVGCGRVGRCGSLHGYSALENETHEVRCCADTPPTTSKEGGGWKQMPGCSVFSGSNEGFECQHSLNYSSAAAFCQNVSSRLCTLKEIQDNCASTTGCSHDSDHIWSSTGSSSAFDIDFTITGLTPENATKIESLINNWNDFASIYSQHFSLARSDGNSKDGLTARGYFVNKENIRLPFAKIVDKCAALKQERMSDAMESEAFKVFTTAGVHTRTIRCRANQRWCDPSTLYFSHYINHASYRLDVAFRHPGLLYVDALNDTAFWDARDDHALRFNQWMKAYKVKFEAYHVSAKYTQFEIGWKYTYIFFTICVMGYWFVAQCRQPFGVWSSQQKWVTVLLVMLFFTNDPFFAAKFEVGQNQGVAEGITTFHILCLVGFLVLLMTFWLEIFEEIEETNSNKRQMQGKQSHGGKTIEDKVKSCCGARLVLAVIFWLTTTTLFCYERLNTAGDPMYNSETDMRHYGMLYVCGALIITLYSAYLLRIIYLCFWQIRQMNAFAMMLFVITCLTIFSTIIGIYANVLSPLQTAAIAFLGYYTIFNSYVWVLAISYRPCEDGQQRSHTMEQSGGLFGGGGGGGFGGGGGGGGFGGGMGGMQQLEDDDEDEGEIELRAVDVVGGQDRERTV